MKKSILSASIAAMIGGLGFAGLANAAVGVNVFTDSVVPSVAIGTVAATTDIKQDGTAATATANAANATAADTVAINEAGVGNILVVPYFTTQGTNATLLNITNTDTNNAKVVKVRFRGASNSDDIFDFTLLLSPGDVWAAKVSQGADGRSQLATSDKSCTLPSTVASQANSFPTGRLNSTLSDADKAAQTREGYIEILNMADVPKAVQTNQSVSTGVTVNPLYTAVKHVSGVAPCTSTVLNNLLTAATDYTASATDTSATSVQGKGMAFPTGQLMANWTIIDTVKTATFSGAAVAVKAYNATSGINAATAAKANVVFFPQSDTAAGNVDAFTSDPLMQTTAGNIERYSPSTGATATGSGTPFIAASYYDLPDLSTPYLANANTPRQHAQSLTAKLAAKSVINEYLTTTSIAATTDWVFSMPTRRYNIAMNYAYTSPIGGSGRVRTLWTNNYFDFTNTSVSNGKICVAADTGAAGVNQWDREETTTSSQFVISPGSVTNVTFCGETSVLAINNGTNTTSGALSSTLALQNLNVNANEGWISLGTSGLASQGLPVLGGAFVKSSSFGAMWPHRFTR